ncbi:hybrid sensor histidine kinase/response regulator transcription factor [Psychroserpens sp.]
MKNILFFLTLIVYFISFGQIQIDSNDNRLSQENINVEKLAQQYHYRFNETIHEPTDSSKIYLELLKKVSITNKNPIYKIWYNQDVGYSLFISGNYKTSILSYQKGLVLAQKNKLLDEVFTCKNWIANNYINLNENKKGIKLYNEILVYAKKENSIDAFISAWTGLSNDNSLAINEKLEFNLKIDSLCAKNNIETAILSNTYNWIGEAYLNHFSNEKLAIKYFNKSLQIAKNVNYEPGIKYVSRLLSDIALKNKEYEKAKDYYTKLIVRFEDYDERLIANTYYELSRIAVLENDNALALNYLQKSSAIFTQLKDTLSLLHNELNKAKVSLNANDFITTKNGIEKLNKIDFKDLNFLINFYKLKSSFYNKTNNYKKAFSYYRKHDSLIEISERNINIEKFAELETKYQSTKNEQEITLLKSKNQLTQQEKKNQRNLFIAGLCIATLAIMFLFVMYKNRKKTNTKLKELDKFKSDFFANISHEFRTPLTLINNPIDAILADDTISDKERKPFEIAKQNSDRLLSLVNQLLDLSKIDAGHLKLRLQKGNVLKRVSALNDSFSYIAKQKDISYSVSIKDNNYDVWFDNDALEKIVTNLLSNAIKYTSKKGKVFCHAEIIEDNLFLEIKNTGNHLTEEELNSIFKRFYQTKNTNSGVGIGLALVKELVELHKGTITVKNEPSTFTTFSVSIPIEKSYFKQEEFISTETETQKIKTQSELDIISEDEEVFSENEKPILLVVEDHNDVRALLKHDFETDYNVITAANGEEGIAFALEHIPDIIISDIMMPIKDGVALTQFLKNDERTSHIPIILLTAKAGNDNKLKGIEVGADDYITKPFNSKLLKAKVTTLIKLRVQLQSRYSQEVILVPKNVTIHNLDEQFLEKVQTILDANLVEPSFTIEEFSHTIGMSRMQLHRKLKALTGLSASEFVRSQRLKLAAQLLKKSDINISQVGYQVGFNNHSYFTKCFKLKYDCTPTEYAIKNS